MNKLVLMNVGVVKSVGSETCVEWYSGHEDIIRRSQGPDNFWEFEEGQHFECETHLKLPRYDLLYIENCVEIELTQWTDDEMREWWNNLPDGSSLPESFTKWEDLL